MIKFSQNMKDTITHLRYIIIKGGQVNGNTINVSQLSYVNVKYVKLPINKYQTTIYYSLKV